ncbi:MAG: hypothetical protein ACJASM_002275, partial [Salibacteraceae bacterium]
MPLEPYLAPVSDLIDVSKIPGNFGALESFAEEGVDLLLGKIYFRDFVAENSNNSDTAYYHLIIATKALRLPIFGSGMNLVLFRGASPNLSEFPITMEVTWPIKKYISDFNSQGFSYLPNAIMDIFLELTDLDEKSFLDQIVAQFLNTGDDLYLDFFNTLKTKISDHSDGSVAADGEMLNISNQLDIIRDTAEDDITNSSMYTVASLLEVFEEIPTYLNAVNSIKASMDILYDDLDIDVPLFKEVILTILSNFNTPEEIIENLVTLFKRLLGDITEEQIKDLIVPQFSIELDNIGMALEFPRNWLSPVIPDPDNVGGFIPNPDMNLLSALEFDAGSLRFSTKGGFEFDLDPGFTFEKAIIGKTGIMLEFLDVKVDMSDTDNIPEANADGRPDDFQGVFVGSASVTLPAKWFKNSNNVDAVIFGEKLLIGTGGFSGTIGLKAMGGTNMFWCEIGEDSGFELGFSSFDIEFKQNKVVESNIKAAMKIEKFVYPASSPSAGQIVEIGIDGHINDEGDFNLTASAVPPFPIELEEVFIYDISSIELGSEDGEFYIGTSGSIQFQGFLKDT